MSDTVLVTIIWINQKTNFFEGKSHTAVTYRKLGVNNVMDAILEAKELGLI